MTSPTCCDTGDIPSSETNAYGPYDRVLVPYADGGVRITIRMSAEDKQAMIEFMRARGLSNISEFIRAAIRWAVNGGMA